MYAVRLWSVRHARGLNAFYRGFEGMLKRMHGLFELLGYERIERPIPEDVIERLNTMPEFVRAYEPDGMQPAEFMAFGATQRTLSQFCEVGWKLMESYR